MTLVKGLFVSACALIATQARAQSVLAPSPVPATNPAGGLEEIVVTAQRRSENLQNVPISVTALGAAQLAERQVIDVNSLSYNAPSLTVGGSYDPTDIVLGIRGISSTIPQIGVDPAIGVYVNGVYLATAPGSNVGFIDMERAEVLRGPQGTLFGRNTIGGNLNITTAKPTGDLSGYVNGSLGNYDLREITGVINVPVISEKFDARVVYQHSEHSGYGRDVYANSDQSDGKQDYVRATARIRPTSGWELMAIGDYFKFTGHSVFQKINYYDTSSPLNAYIPALNGHPGDLISNYVGGNFYQGSAGINPPTAVESYSGNITATGKLDSEVNVRSITGYRHIARTEGSDVDGTPYPLFDILADPFRARELSEELQFYGDAFDKRLNWITGAYYFNENGFQGILFEPLSPLAGYLQNLDLHIKSRSYAAFAQVTYEIADGLKLTSGIRYTKDNRSAAYADNLRNYDGSFLTCSLAGVALTPNATNQSACFFNKSASFHYLPFTVGLDYRANEKFLAYAKVSKGYRSGGFQQSGPTPASNATTAADSLAAANAFKAFDPESNTSYEVGFKSDLLDRHLRVNLASFYSNYARIQQSLNTSNGSGGTLSVVENVGTAHIYGGELEISALFSRLRMDGSLGYVHTKYVSGPEVGVPFVNAPKLTGALAISYPIDLPIGELNLHGVYSYRSSEFYFFPIAGNIQQTQAVQQKGYSLVDVNAVLKLGSSPITLSVFCRNLFDKEYKARVTDLVSAGLGFDTYIAGNPRTFGGSIRFDF